jgi:hypothetical protein
LPRDARELGGTMNTFFASFPESFLQVRRARPGGVHERRLMPHRSVTRSKQRLHVVPLTGNNTHKAATLPDEPFSSASTN